ncbi:hypothetical protein KP509_04G012600 [Ceratopteris richardii]|uniref:Uncharacterized protein n=1 Tax=Ceratopteris richardii TaxID=49495 RepID=A0A8T2UY23_CERRI|nr:hypothetical protein KP509_04G012600 [Ceratopteris richardii]
MDTQQPRAASIAAPGRPDSERFSNLKLAFSMATHCLLTAFSREQFGEHFFFLNLRQQDALYKLYTQMVVSVQENIQEEFKDICEETRAADACDDGFLLAQELDNNGARKRIMATGRKSILSEKMKELEYLKQMLGMMKEKNQDCSMRLKALKHSVEWSENIEEMDAVMMKLKELSSRLGSTVGNKNRIEFN